MHGGKPLPWPQAMSDEAPDGAASTPSAPPLPVDHKEIAIAIVKEAIAHDHAQNYADAFNTYHRALEVFLLAIKHEPLGSVKKQLEAKMASYMDRAEALKKVLSAPAPMAVAVGGGGDAVAHPDRTPERITGI